MTETTTIAALGVVLLILALYFCVLELSVLLVHRLRLEVLEDVGNARARLVNRILKRQDLAATSANIGVQLSIASLAAVSWFLGSRPDLAMSARVSIVVFTVLLLVLLVTLLPRVIVPARPTRVLLLLAYPFALSCWALYPLSRLLLAVRSWLARRVGGDTVRWSDHPSLVLREDLRKLISRPELAILGEREREMALKLFRFGSTLVRDLMTPTSKVVSLEEGATVEDVFRAVRSHGYTRIPIYRENEDQLVGLVNVHDVLDAPPWKKIAGWIRPAPRVAPTSLAHTLFVHLQRNPDWVAFVESNGRCEGIVTVEDLVEEVLGELTDEFELPRPRYAPSGRRRLRVHGQFSLRELGRDLRVAADELEDVSIADALRQRIGRVPIESESVEIQGLRVRVLSVIGDDVLEVEVARSR